ncbi:hypothetical protein SPBR_00030 [Sporothrix brasiliensis 5110]|uniref:ABC transporter n=1 Tax=Sporothrix brasiliensis 5110 TaxID=1398154 RepID=A0A0C2FFZ8_9PEZI|nr:uncharacterized protein SPBR_00030 [Sporothrix brasiliensis 5110]KIH90038.1 hypothetical protein SPBR_00030 [Sporothrix brasiliensis 5110]
MAELQTVLSWRARPSAQDGLFLAAGLASWIFLLVLPVRLRQLHLASVKVNTSRLAFYKIAASLLLIVACFSSAFILARSDTSGSFAAQWSMYGGPAASVAVAILSFQEHRRNLRPSNTIVLYLVATLAIDLVSLAVPLRFGWPTTFYGAKIFEATAKGTLLFLESRCKKPILREEFHDVPPEELAGVLSLTYFWWLHDLLQLGYDKVLLPADLPRMDSKLESDPLRQKILAVWETRGRSFQEQKAAYYMALTQFALVLETPEKPTTLPRALFSCFSVPITLVAIPRLFLILFQFSQPVLISRAISFVQGLTQEQSIDDNASAAGSWIVVAAVFVYFGLMTSTVVYRHLLDRIQVMLKGALVGIIHQKSLTGRSHAYDDGKALTLISTDVVEIEGAAEMFHELWAFCLEAAVGFSMLAMEIGWLWPLPVGIVFVFSQTSRYAVRPMKARQTAWNEATQKRLSMTSSILGAIKSVKILGIQTAVEDVILQLRENELLAAKGVRWVNVLYNSSANALGLFSPVLTVALYAILASAHGKEFDTRTAFTTTAILSMITHPINMVMTILPRIAASMSSFERIQTYLLRPSVDDKRVSTEHEDISRTSDAVAFTDVTIPDQQNSKPILQSVNFSIAKGSLTIVTGPVGAGKTLLMHSILGETIFSKGTVAVSSLKMAFCSQTAWLPNRTIRECILGLDGGVHVDQTRYDKVLEACCLLEDFGALPDGDQTVVGTGGQNLSGGQRQRVAIARAVYSDLDIFIFDDSFSALDSKTQSAVINNLLGPSGLLRNNSIAVIWVTNNQSYFSLSDKVIVLLISQPLLGVTLPVCVAIVYVVQKRYLRTSRQLRRIELESQSAVYFNILETVSGVQTIRAFGWQDTMAKENAVSLDNSQRPVYLTLSLQRWLNVVLDAVVACIAVGTVWLAVWGALAGGSSSQPILRFSPSGGHIGVALNIILVTNTTLLRLIQTWTNLEVSLGAVARLREATHETPQEESLLDKDASEANGDAGGQLPANWPSTGKIELANVTASYSQDTPVLNGVNLSINPGQVAVICGRTGSITIDGINLAGLQLDDIRERAFVTVSQDPFLLPGASLRFHLDPTETLPDRTLAEALQKTGLFGLFVGSSYDEHDAGDVDGATASLWDRALSSFPVLSAGQAQLLSLARALLQLQTRSCVSSETYSDREHGKRMPIILLDEITASLDAETEAAVYDVVEEVFIKSQQGAGHTVLIVTHRPAALTRRLRPGQDATVWMSSGKVERVEPVEVED